MLSEISLREEQLPHRLRVARTVTFPYRKPYRVASSSTMPGSSAFASARRARRAPSLAAACTSGEEDGIETGNETAFFTSTGVTKPLFRPP